MKRGLLAVVRFYQQAISPALPARCRFYPTCSAYAVEAIEVHGAGRGAWLALRRLARCAPWHPGGLDPVPHAGPGGTGRARPSSSTGAPVPRPAPAVRPSPITTPPAGQHAAAQEESSVA